MSGCNQPIVMAEQQQLLNQNANLLQPSGTLLSVNIPPVLVNSKSGCHTTLS